MKPYMNDEFIIEHNNWIKSEVKLLVFLLQAASTEDMLVDDQVRKIPIVFYFVSNTIRNIQIYMKKTFSTVNRK